MSLEQRIDELTKAIATLTAVLLDTTEPKDAVFCDSDKAPAEDWKPATSETIESTLPSVLAVVVPVEIILDAPETEKVTEYEDVKRMILRMAAIDRAMAVTTLGNFGAASGPKLQECDYGKFIDAALAAIEAHHG
jgi:hypothetical protein